jgi:hypothetical protein
MANKVKEGRYLINKDIPLDSKGEKKIGRGHELYLTNGVFYLDGTLLPQDYQLDFRELLTNETENGWNYVVPANPKVGKSMV